MSVIADMLDRLAGVSALKERLSETNRNAERSLAWMLDHEKRLIRLEAVSELAAPVVQKAVRARLPPADK